MISYNEFINENSTSYKLIDLYETASDFKTNYDDDIILGGMNKNVDTDSFLNHIYKEVKNKRIYLYDYDKAEKKVKK